MLVKRKRETDGILLLYDIYKKTRKLETVNLLLRLPILTSVPNKGTGFLKQSIRTFMKFQGKWFIAWFSCWARQKQGTWNVSWFFKPIETVNLFYSNQCYKPVISISLKRFVIISCNESNPFPAFQLSHFKTLEIFSKFSKNSKQKLESLTRVENWPCFWK